MPFPRAVLFDFDGVILESADIKTEAFRALFASRPRHAAAIARYHGDNAGVSRFRKFDHIYRHILKEPLTPALRRDLGRRFSGLVFDQVMACPFVPGARRFLARHRKDARLFVLSGTPQAELRRIVKGRGLAASFKGVFGSPRTKGALAALVLRRYRIKPPEAVLVGDAMADHDAAAAVGIPFIGRVPRGGKGPFPRGTVRIPDLRSLEKAIRGLSAGEGKGRRGG